MLRKKSFHLLSEIKELTFQECKVFGEMANSGNELQDSAQDETLWNSSFRPI